MTREKFAIHYEGKLGDFVGRVYNYQRGEKTFTPETHPMLFAPADNGSERDRLRIPAGWEIVGGADTGTFTSALVVAMSPEGECFILEEFPNYDYRAGSLERDEQITIPSWSRILKLRTEGFGGRAYYWADPNTQFKSELKNYGIYLMGNKTPLETRTEIAREYFQHDRVWLAPWLKVLPFELENASWPEEATASGKFSREKDRDHTLDCLEHILSKRPLGKWVESPPKWGTWIESYVGRSFKEKRTIDPHLGVQ